MMRMLERSPPTSAPELLAKIESQLSGPAPPNNGPPAVTLSEWVDRVLAGEEWPPNAPEGLSLTWSAARESLRDAAAARGAEPGGAAMALDGRWRSAVRRLGAYTVILALNGRESGDGSRAPGPRFPVNMSVKQEALRKLIEGWTPAGRTSGVPPFDELVLGASPCAAAPLATMGFYIDLLRCILNDARDAAGIPTPVRPFLTTPVIVANDAWVRFLIRFHRREATVREGIARLFGRPGGGNAAAERKEFWALRGVDFAAYPGDTVGVIGRNGSGKTTLLKTLAGILSPDRGSVSVRGKVGCLLSFGVGFNVHLSGRENVFLNGSILGLSQREIAQKLDQIISFSELGEFIDAPVRTYSAGMRGRLGFSIAVNIDPDVLILDEVLTVGDDYFQKKAGSILDRFRRSSKTVVIASHSMDLIRRVATRAIWIDQGKIRMNGDPTEVTRAYVADCRKLREAAGIRESDSPTGTDASPSGDSTPNLG